MRELRFRRVGAGAHVGRIARVRPRIPFRGDSSRARTGESPCRNPYRPAAIPPGQLYDPAGVQEQPGRAGHGVELDPAREAKRRRGDHGIYITGYASPEGSEAHNLVLSRTAPRRSPDISAVTTASPPNCCMSNGAGEDWDGSVEALDDYPQLLGLDRIRELIAKYPGNRDYCELAFRRLEPPAIYRRLLNEVYPPLRRNEYRIEIQRAQFRSGGGAADDRRAARPAESGGDVQGRRAL